MDKQVQIFGKSAKMKQAKEPTNYNWENMGYSMLRRTIGFIISMAVMLFLIFIAYYMQFKMEGTVKYLDNYEQFDCSVFHHSYETAEAGGVEF